MAVGVEEGIVSLSRHQNVAKEIVLRVPPFGIPRVSWYETQQGLTVIVGVRGASIEDDLLALRH